VSQADFLDEDDDDLVADGGVVKTKNELTLKVTV
jgi:hypothetical protein